jgi:hypothetical protein
MVAVRVQAVDTCLFRHHWVKSHVTAQSCRFTCTCSTKERKIFYNASGDMSPNVFTQTHSSPPTRTSCRGFLGRWSERNGERDRGRLRQSSGEQDFEELSKRMVQLMPPPIMIQILDALFGVLGGGSWPHFEECGTPPIQTSQFGGKHQVPFRHRRGNTRG